MRTGLDRLRQALMYEGIALVVVTPLASMLLDQQMQTMGLFTIGMSLLAMSWNGLFNWLFDHGLVAVGRPVQPRGVGVRVVHAVLYEAGLFGAAIPFAMVVLDLNFWEGFAAQTGFAVFFLAYAYVFSWGYDRVFPTPMAAEA